MFLIRNLEEILASIAISITVLVVIINVFLRYFMGFVVPWSEELSVLCFICAVYLGVSSCYKHKMHMGVDVILTVLPPGAQRPFHIFILTLLLVFNLTLVYLSFSYTLISKKVTPVMGISYAPINSVLVFCFALMALHTLRFLWQEIRQPGADNSTKPD